MTSGHTMQAFCLMSLGVLFCAREMDAQPQPQSPTPMPTPLKLMPYPAEVQQGTGALRIDASFFVVLGGYTEPRLHRAVERFHRQLFQQTAIPLTPVAAAPAIARSAPSAPALLINTDHASKDIQELGEDEGYTLEVMTGVAKLNASTPLGVLRGLQTFLQLVEVTPDGFAVPAVTIHDQPRFPWRGLMIDSGRHYIPLDVIKRNLDAMEAVKMNVFHWHLSENQGFRVESKKFPRLHELGSDHLYYTQEEVRDLIAYARDRGIRVVPEFDMPGHSTAWFVGYPELASGPGPYQIERKWGVFDPAMDPTNDKTYKFLDEFIAEMAKLFPDHFFHIGGDEVNGKQWDANPKIQEFKKSHNLATNAELQGYFSKKVQAIVTKHGKAVVGWDEVFIPGAPKEIMIQSWRGQAALAQAAQQGYRGILSNGYYIDLGWSAARHYANDPLAGAGATLTPEQQKLVLGGESTMWSEYVNAENIDSRIWPRNVAIAERLWSPQNVTDVASMYARLDVIGARLEWLGLTHRSYHRRMLQRIAGPASAEEFAALRTLADVVEPVKDYAREKLAPAEPTSLTPMNRLVDAVPLESDSARRFAETIDKFVASSCHDAEIEERLRARLTAWRDNDAKLQPLTQRSFLVKEATDASTALSSLGATGVAALDYIAKGSPAPDSWKTQQVAAIAEIQKPKGQLLVIPSAAVQKLVEAAATGGACAKP